MKPLMLTRRATLMSMAAMALPALPARAAATGKVTIALDWTPNTNHIGLFIARDKGFYREAGVDVEILPYSDTSATTLVANHVADFGIAGSIGLLTQHAAGADLVGVYAVTQTETGRLVTLGSRADIKRPKDLDGLKYGGFGSAWENALIGSIIRQDGGKGEFETITLGTSAYQALDSGSVDFTLEVFTWEGVEAQLKGVKLRDFRYADYGVPDEHTTLIVSNGAVLADRKPAAQAFLKATRRGYQFAVDNPDQATDLLIAANSDALTDRALVRTSLQTLIDGHYFRTADGVIGYIDPAKMEGLGDYMVKSGILKGADGNPIAGTPDFSSYFANI